MCTFLRQRNKERKKEKEREKKAKDEKENIQVLVMDKLLMESHDVALKCNTNFFDWFLVQYFEGDLFPVPLR